MRKARRISGMHFSRSSKAKSDRWTAQQMVNKGSCGLAEASRSLRIKAHSPPSSPLLMVAPSVVIDDMIGKITSQGIVRSIAARTPA